MTWTHRHRTAPLALSVLLALLVGCRQENDGAEQVASAAPAPRVEEAAASHILVAYTGCRDCPAGVTRTREEAETRARQISVLLRSGRGEFDALARKYSDDATARRNSGYLGVFRRGEMDPAFELSVFRLAAGAISEPIETPYGWHVVRREEVRRARAHHILVAWREAAKAADGIQRDRREARRIAEALRREAASPGTDLCDLARKYSDDPHTRLECGDIGWLEPGVLEQEVDTVLFSLAPHEVSPVIETAYGYHIFWRE